MAHISPLRALVPAMSQIADSFGFFSSAKKKFNDYLEDGFYGQTAHDAFYIYRVKRPHRSHTGIIARANVIDYIEGNVKKHENTLSAKEDKMLGLFYERNAMIKPILLTYPNAWELDALINRLTIASAPSLEIPFGDETHIFWEISQAEQLNLLRSLFETHVPTTYICDGHHRAASSERLYTQSKSENPNHTGLEPYNFILAAYFPISEIEVHNYNRYVVNVGMEKTDFLQRLESVFDMQKMPKEQIAYPAHQHQVGMFYQKSWYLLDFKENQLQPLRKSSIKDRLDVEMLNKLIIEQVVGVADVRTDANVQYLEGVQGAQALAREVAAQPNSAGFLMYPVALEDLIAIANADDTMPPKSTWIEPRMRNGFIVQMYE